MITVYVEKAKDLPACDMNGKSDAYVVLFGRTEFASFQFGKTDFISNSLDPVWDEDHKKPYKIEFIRATCLYFEVWDHDYLSKDDKIGYTYFDWSTQKLGETVELSLTPSFQSKLYVTVLPPKEVEIPIQLWTKQQRSMYLYCTAQPPLTNKVFAKITLLEDDHSNPGKQLCNVLNRSAQTRDKNDANWKHGAFQNMGLITLIDGKGTTNVLRIKPKRVSPNCSYIPAVHNIKGYRGTIILHIKGVGPEKKNGTTNDNREIRIVDPSLSSDIMQLSITIESDEPTILPSSILFSPTEGVITGLPSNSSFRTLKDPKTNCLVFC